MVINFLVDYTCGRHQHCSAHKHLLNEKLFCTWNDVLGETTAHFYFNQTYVKVPLIKRTAASSGGTCDEHYLLIFFVQTCAALYGAHTLVPLNHLHAGTWQSAAAGPGLHLHGLRRCSPPHLRDGDTAVYIPQQRWRVTGLCAQHRALWAGQVWPGSAALRSALGGMHRCRRSRQTLHQPDTLQRCSSFLPEPHRASHNKRAEAEDQLHLRQLRASPSVCWWCFYPRCASTTQSARYPFIQPRSNSRIVIILCFVWPCTSLHIYTYIYTQYNCIVCELRCFAKICKNSTEFTYNTVEYLCIYTYIFVYLFLSAAAWLRVCVISWSCLDDLCWGSEVDVVLFVYHDKWRFDAVQL